MVVTDIGRAFQDPVLGIETDMLGMLQNGCDRYGILISQDDSEYDRPSPSGSGLSRHHRQGYSTIRTDIDGEPHVGTTVQ